MVLGVEFLLVGPSYSLLPFAPSNKGLDNYSSRSGATSRSSLYRPSSRASLPSFLSLQNSSYRVLQDDEDKWLTEIPVDPIFMEHTDKINVKVVKYSLQISCEVFDTIGEGRMAKTQRES